MAERIPSLDAHLHLPGKMKLSSHRAGWRSLLLRGYNDPPSTDEFLTPATDDHLIVLVTGGFCAINVRYRSGWRTAQQRRGILAMTAPGEAATLRWNGDSSHSTLQLHLPDATVRRVREDLDHTGGPRRLLMSGVGICDPFVEQLMIASANAVRLGASDLYAETTAEMLAVYMMGRGDPLSVSIGREERRLRLVDDFMRDNLSSPITLERLAEVAGLSRFHILRLFNRHFGESPLKRLTRLRMEQAAVLLRSTTETVTAIAEFCGYENPSHFATAFRRHHALSPREYRKMK